MAGGNSAGGWTWGTLPTPQDPSHQAPGLGTEPLALPQTQGGEKKKTPHPEGRLRKVPEASGKEVSREGGGAQACPSWALLMLPPLKKKKKKEFLLQETFSLKRPTASRPFAHPGIIITYAYQLTKEDICTLRKGQQLGAGAPSKMLSPQLC